MKINYLKLHCNKKKNSKISTILKLTICFLFVGTVQLHAVYDTLSPERIDPHGNLIHTDQQEIKITGIVTDSATNEVLTGVTVAVEGTTTGALTDVNGKYMVIVPSASSVLVFSYIGYTTVRIPVNGQSSINVSLTGAILKIDEVVVVGYGTQKKATVTGSVVAIKNAELMQSPQANISNALVGRMSGLLSVQRSGQPGGDQSVLKIRGTGTFAGSQDPLIMVDGIETDNYDNIDPNEIDNISILKDASATAVYGVRGANGVLLITTKRGKVGKPQVSFTTQYASSKFPDFRHSMNAADYANSYNLVNRYDSYITGGYIPQFTDKAIAKYKSHEDPIFYPDIDWFPYMFDKSSGQTQDNLNISGGTEKVKYFVSVGYFNQEALINNTELIKDYDAQLRYKKYNIRTNFDFNITKRLSSNVNISSQIENRSGTSADINGIFEGCWASNPVDGPGIVDGKYVTIDGAIGKESPFAWLYRAGYQKDYRNYLESSVRFNYKLDFITEGLSSHATVSYNNFNQQRIVYNKNFVSYRARQLADSSIIFVPESDPGPFGFSESFGKNRKVYAEIGLDYARKFGDHNFTGLLLYNQSKRYDPSLQFLVPNGYQGLVGRVTYDYKGRYLAEVNVGYNGTENFAPGKRFGLFPAYSLGWVTSDEPFFPQNNYITYLKIRGSYGVVGNDKIGGNRFLYRPASYTYSSNMYYFGEDGSNLQGYQGSVEGALGNSDLTWERSRKMNIGADFSFLKDKFKATFDYFEEKRDNILANMQTVPLMVGFTFPPYNLGKMSNSGYEFDLSFVDNFGKFNYWVKANFTYAHNVIKFQDEVQNPYSYLNRTGQRYGQYFGLVENGFFNSWEEVNDVNRPVYAYNNNKIQPGDIKMVDINGDGIINYEDSAPIGYSNFPEKIFGISFGGDFKGFDFSVLFQGASNVSIAYSRRYNQPFRQGSGSPDYFLESWSQERLDQGLPINYPRFGQLGELNSTSSTFWTRDASYLRLKNAELGFTVPEKWLNKIGLASVRAYINGNNLFTWDRMLPGADPESAANYVMNSEPYPVTRTINIGCNIKF